MEEKLVIELVAIVGGLVWLLGLTIRARHFKKNDLHGFERKLGKLCGTVEQIDERLTRLEHRFDGWVNGKDR